MILSLLCNDEKNGVHTGYCDAIRYDDKSNERCTFSTFTNKIKCSFDYNKNILKVGRIKIDVKWHRDMFGNWCWNAYCVKWKDVKNVILYIKKVKNWAPDEGRTQIYDWWYKR